MEQSSLQKIGNTPLEKYTRKVPNNNIIFLKKECSNPFGSHYDRVYLALFRYYEQQGILKKGDKVFETSSGTAGASFAGIAKELGYEAHVAIPKGIDNAVIKVIQNYGAKIYFTPEKDYINGFPKFLKEFRPWDKGFIYLNHSMGRKTDSGFSDNQVTLDALGDIAREVKEKIDYYIPAVGNGSSVLGPGRIFKERGAKIVAFESFQSAVAYDKLYSGKYENEFGIKPGTLPRHKLRGTSYQGINFPHIAHAFEQKLIDEVYLVSDKDKDADYKKLTHKNPPILPHWDSIPKGEYGKSTRAGLAVALELAKKVKNKTMLVIWYDYANRYD